MLTIWLLQVAAVQEQGQTARVSIVSEALHSLEPTASSEQSRTAHAQKRATKQDVAAEHAAEHANALQTVSRGSAERSGLKKANATLSEAAELSKCRDTAAAAGRPSAQTRAGGRWPCARPPPKRGSMAPDPLPALGSPVPCESDMSQRPAADAAAMPHLNCSSQQPNGTLDSISL